MPLVTSDRSPGVTGSTLDFHPHTAVLVHSNGHHHHHVVEGKSFQPHQEFSTSSLPDLQHHHHNHGSNSLSADPTDPAQLAKIARLLNLLRKGPFVLMADQFDCALDLTRRLPPQNTEENLAKLLKVVPHLTEDLLSSIDQPLKVQRCRDSGKDYLMCDYNRDGDSYRSPWSNNYDPPLGDGAVPTDKLRKLEVSANEAFDTYRDMYFEGGVSSVYLWDMDDGFAGVVLLKKVGDNVNRMTGAWDSIHVVEATERGRTAHYKLTSTVMLYMITTSPELGNMNLSGSMTRRIEVDMPVDLDPSTHIANIGRMVEDMELKMRNQLQEVYFGKTKDIVNDLRSINSISENRKQADIQRELVGKLLQQRG